MACCTKLTEFQGASTKIQLIFKVRQVCVEIQGPLYFFSDPNLDARRGYPQVIFS